MERDKKNVLLFELRDDTFEVSVLCVDDGICEVLATTGDARLTFKKIVQHLVEHFIILHKRETTKDMHRDERAVQNLRREVEKATYELCIQTETQIKVFDSILVDEHYVSKFTRTEFEDLTQSSFEKMKDHIKKLLTKAELQKEDVSEIVLVGSAARIPKIQELLKELCDGQVLTSTNNQMISYRAAIKEKKDKSVSKGWWMFGAGIMLALSSMSLSGMTMLERSTEEYWICFGCFIGLLLVFIFCLFMSR